MISILLCKNQANSILKKILYQVDQKNIRALQFTINNKLRFIDSFQFLTSSIDSLVKNLNKDDFKYFRKEFDNNDKNDNA